MTPTLTLRTALGDAAPLESLHDEGVRFDRRPVNILEAFRSMCRTLSDDVCEMALVTYFAARRYGVPMTAIPVFPLSNLVGRRAPATFLMNRTAGIEEPSDLQGRRVGVRSYTFTPGIWARGILKEQLGVDIDGVAWVVNDEEHVEQFHEDTPPNVERRLGVDLGKLLADGEIAGGIMLRTDSPHVVPAFPEVHRIAAAAFERAGVVPLDHAVVIRTALLDEHPWLARTVFEAMKRSKAEWRRRTPNAPVESDLSNDPMPVGLSRARASLEKLMQLSVEQHVLDEALDIDELFPGRLD